MPQFATARSVRQAGRLIKRLMNFHPEGWAALEERGRQGLREAIEEAMKDHRSQYLEQQLSRGEYDRCNGFFRRHLLTSLGDIELSVPRTRSWSAVGLVQAYARRAGNVDRAILACFVLGLSTRKVAEALLPIFGERVRFNHQCGRGL
jgi:transposase-like protein